MTYYPTINTTSPIVNQSLVKTATAVHNPFTYAFLAMQTDSKDPIYIENPIGICVVELLGQYAEEIHVVQLALLPCDKLRVIDGIISIHQQCGLKQIAMDLDTMKWLNADRAYSRKVDSLAAISSLSYPSLFAIPTPVDLRIYEESVLLSRLRLNEITYHPSFEKNPDGSRNTEGERDIASAKQYGISPLAYAFAGAVERAVIARNWLLSEAKQRSANTQIKVTKDNLTLSNNGYII